LYPGASARFSTPGWAADAAGASAARLAAMAASSNDTSGRWPARRRRAVIIADDARRGGEAHAIRLTGAPGCGWLPAARFGHPVRRASAARGSGRRIIVPPDVTDTVVRRIHATEAGQLRELRLTALAGAPDAFQRTYAEEAAEGDEFWRRRAADAAASDAVATFVAVRGGRHVATATGIRPEGEDTVRLVAMWVEPDVRGTGIAAALVEAVTDWAGERGASEVELDVREHNLAARRLYERCGFTVAGTPSTGSRCELRMARRLP
jgi:RimJ/RimL family protein N-acetyltransferase